MPQTTAVSADVEPPRALGTGAPQTREELLAAPLRSLPRPARLGRPITSLRGAGPKLSKLAAKAGLNTVGDLLWHLPHGYRDRTRVTRAADLRIGEEATVSVEVRSARVRPTRRRNLKIVEATVTDGSGSFKAVWFNQAWLAERLRPGTRMLLSGRLDRSGFRVSAHEIVGDGSGGAGIHTTGIVPVHSTVEGLRAERIREWAWQAVANARDAHEPLPASVRARLRLPLAADALRAVHFPKTMGAAEAARRRLALQELALHQVALAVRRRARDEARRGIPFDPPGELTARWLESLPFEPTEGQRNAFAEIDADLASGRAMQRLLMGEVGSGKTVVALYAMLRAIEGGYQAALMAPTETLAEQHARTLDRLLANEQVPFTLLTSSTSAAQRRDALDKLRTGELAMVVGTHALIEPDVEFARLAVCIVDEQHRFGVRQRAALDEKGPAATSSTEAAAPHVLHMTATPIPRTLSLTTYGDLDTTILRELPAGRQPVKTWLVGEDRRAGAYEFVRERLREGHQAYFVCPLVEGSEKLEAKAAADEAERLASGEFADFEVALLHGQMPAREKAAVMERFASGAAHVLVATTVIEVGIDVPNATVMVIEGAERYGISQLHQLRGRVGRGAHESYCILFGDPASDTARRRLEAVAAERDGFKLAEIDLTIRGEGEILGTRQHGLPEFHAAQLPEDGELLVAARREVRALLAEHGSFEAPELQPLLDAARERFGDERERGIIA